MGRSDVRLYEEQTRPLVLLDRDGVLNLDVGYPYRPDQVQWVAGAFCALARLKSAGYRCVVVTNQSGVARGFYSEADVLELHTWMATEIAEHGGEIAAFYHCPYHPDATIDVYRREHEDRKPSPGMIRRALADFPTDLRKSFLVGDRDTDIAAAQAAGVPGYLFSGGDLDAFIERCLLDFS